MKTMTVLYVLTVSRLSYMCHSDCLICAIFKGGVALALNELEGQAALGAEEEDEDHDCLICADCLTTVLYVP